MPSYSFDWVDAFTTTPFGGNGCAVFHDAAGLDVETRTAIVRETKLSECAYLVGSDVADFGARYYLAGREILMAGHPTIATVRSLVHRGMVDVSGGRAEITLEVGAGVLPIEITMEDGEPLICMTQAAPEFGAKFEAAEIAAIYGLEADDVVGVPQIVSTGTPFCITAMKDRATVERAVLLPDLLEAWQIRLGHPQAAVMEPFLVALEGATDTGDTFARLLMAPPNPGEDPFTGSATGCMAAYLWARGLIEAPRFTAEQGHGLGRPGQAQVEVLGPRASIAGVKVAGRGVVLMDGAIHL